MTAEPATPGFDITRYEIRRFMSALGLDPADVDAFSVFRNRVIATLIDGSTIHIRIVDPRGQA
jgi:hypothetical protein